MTSSMSRTCALFTGKTRRPWMRTAARSLRPSVNTTEQPVSDFDALDERIVARVVVVAHVVNHAAAIRAALAAADALLAEAIEFDHVDEFGRVAGHVVEHHLLGGGEIGVHGHEAVRGDGDP